MPAAKLLKLSLPESAWVLACSDIHLSSPSDQNQEWVLHKLSERIKANWDKPGVIVLNGDIVEAWQPNSRLTKDIQAHKVFWKLLKDYLADSKHSVIYIVGNHDGEMAWNDDAIAKIERLSGAKVGLQLEVSLSNGKKLLFDHGHQLDPDNAFVDQLDPNDKPFGKYVVQKIIPTAKESSPKLFANLEHLINRSAAQSVIWSRVFYTYLVPIFLLSVVVFAFSFIMFMSTTVTWQQYGLFLLMAIATVLILSIATTTVVMNIKLKKQVIEHYDNQNAKKLLANINTDVIAYLSGHTHLEELKKENGKLLINSGYGTVGLVAAKSWPGLPDGFVLIRHASWCELQLSHDLMSASLFEVQQRIGSANMFAKLACSFPSKQAKSNLQKLTLSL